MAGYSARQSSFTTGDTILAAHSNDEFNQVLAAFHATTGHSHDGTAGEGGPVTTLRDADALNKILVDTSNNHLEFYVEVSSAAVQQLRIQDGAIVPITDNDIDLGTSSLEFKDLFIDGTANIDSLVADAMSLGGTSITATGAEINLIDGGSTIGTTAVVDADGIIHNDGGTMKVTSAATFKTYFQSGLSTAYDDFTTGDAAVNIATSAGDITIDAQGNDTDIILKGTDGGADTTFLTIDGSAAGKATFNSDVVVGGDLTVTGDDITMGTNTAGNLLIADGTNFNSVAVGSLSEISTIASDDVFLAVDTSGGGLKKVARSTVVSGLATSSAISNVVEDTTPQLGGNLDMNGQDIVTTSNADLELAPNGTGHVTIKGNDNPGTIQFNCENNSHGQQLKPQPHSVGSSAVHTLPNVTGELMPGKIEGSNFTGSLLVGHATSGTLSTAIRNTGVGIVSLDALTEGDNNTAVGYNSGTSLTTGSSNTAIGSTALVTSTNSSNNTAVGLNALRDATSGSNNTAIGSQAGLVMSGGSAAYNTLLGVQAGDNISSGAGNVVIGSVDVDTATGDRQLKIAGYDGSTTTTWISGNSDGDLTFAHDVVLANDSFIQFGDAGETIAGDGTDLTITTSNDITIDAANDIILDAGGADVFIKDDGTQYLRIARDGNFDVNFICNQDKAFEFNGNDGGAGTITGLKIDIAAAGEATFNAGIVIADAGNIGSASDKDAMAIASNGVVTFSQTPVNSAGAAFVTDDPTALAIALG